MSSSQATARIGPADANYLVHLQAGSHALVGDESAGLGGTDQGPPPFAFVLSGLVSCTAITLKMYMQRKQWPVADVEVTAVFQGKDEARFIRREVRVSGAELGEAERKRLAEICERTPVTLFLKAASRIETTLL
ncbi:OsmC family protein [Cupriavidus basilensis]|jgi:putative redox protein|uniref:OsmC family protein n=1 Tax=Cupriavidus TaxID=106589 RepID=UPI00044DDA92|nr:MULTISPECIES: OsmC family protein [Cupriavidus]KDP84622.1 peroxiredoxin [Cupriavidus sp. SK-3]MDF3885111.1 OsmC family protein [Cupriavidus basilensis]